MEPRTVRKDYINHKYSGGRKNLKRVYGQMKRYHGEIKSRNDVWCKKIKTVNEASASVPSSSVVEVNKQNCGASEPKIAKQDSPPVTESNLVQNTTDSDYERMYGKTYVKKVTVPRKDSPNKDSIQTENAERHLTRYLIPKTAETQQVKPNPSSNITVQCEECNIYIKGSILVCVQCPGALWCSACTRSSQHARHYLLRVPRGRSQNEINQVLESVRALIRDQMAAAETEQEIPIQSTSSALHQNYEDMSQSEYLKPTEMPQSDDLEPTEISQSDNLKPTGIDLCVGFEPIDMNQSDDLEPTGMEMCVELEPTKSKEKPGLMEIENNEELEVEVENMVHGEDPLLTPALEVTLPEEIKLEPEDFDKPVIQSITQTPYRQVLIAKPSELTSLNLQELLHKTTQDTPRVRQQEDIETPIIHTLTHTSYRKKIKPELTSLTLQELLHKTTQDPPRVRQQEDIDTPIIHTLTHTSYRKKIKPELTSLTLQELLHKTTQDPPRVRQQEDIDTPIIHTLTHTSYRKKIKPELTSLTLQELLHKTTQDTPRVRQQEDIDTPIIRTLLTHTPYRKELKAKPSELTSSDLQELLQQTTQDTPRVRQQEDIDTPIIRTLTHTSYRKKLKPSELTSLNLQAQLHKTTQDTPRVRQQEDIDTPIIRTLTHTSCRKKLKPSELTLLKLKRNTASDHTRHPKRLSTGTGNTSDTISTKTGCNNKYF